MVHEHPVVNYTLLQLSLPSFIPCFCPLLCSAFINNIPVQTFFWKWHETEIWLTPISVLSPFRPAFLGPRLCRYSIFPADCQTPSNSAATQLLKHSVSLAFRLHAGEKKTNCRLLASGNCASPLSAHVQQTMRTRNAYQLESSQSGTELNADTIEERGSWKLVSLSYR